MKNTKGEHWKFIFTTKSNLKNDFQIFFVFYVSTTALEKKGMERKFSGFFLFDE